MKIVIMVGGKGTRIASINSEIPKPMIPILDKPIDVKNYTKEVFGEDIKTEILYSPKKTKEMVIRFVKK